MYHLGSLFGSQTHQTDRFFLQKFTHYDFSLPYFITGTESQDRARWKFTQKSLLVFEGDMYGGVTTLGCLPIGSHGGL